jgi:uncharacterized RmlC-like cupin family protein/ketosteroid isomerase-like protein
MALRDRMERLHARRPLTPLLLGIALVGAVPVLGLAAATGQRTANISRAEQEVRRLEGERSQALLQRDVARLDRTMAEEYVFTTPDGQVVTKSQEMAGFRSGETRFAAFKTEDLRVRVYGNSAVVTARARIRGQSHGRDIGGDYRYTRVYAKPSGRWQIVASHFTRGAPAVAAHRTEKAADEVVTVRPPTDMATRQGLRQFVGISQATVGARGISMNLVVVPAGGAAEPHLHRGFESAVYVLKGRVETRYGPGLRKSVINQEGDFLFIPPDLPHQPRNLSGTEPALAVVARNDPNEQEHVIHYDPAAASTTKP